MKDMPMFITDYGVASLTLRELPYSKRAYIRVQSSDDVQKLLKECADFCRAVGAEEIYATGESFDIAFPYHTDILEMNCLRSALPETDAVAVLVEDQQLSMFKDIYNEKMQNIPNAAYFSIQDAKDMLNNQCGYIVRQNGNLIGIGIAADDTIQMLAALEPGKGKDVLSALSMRLQSDIVRVEVASANTKAMTLYNRLGFQTSQALARWYKIL